MDAISSGPMAKMPAADCIQSIIFVEKEKREEKIEMIARMKRVGKLSFDEISEITGFTVEEIEAIKVADNDHD